MQKMAASSSEDGLDDSSRKDDASKQDNDSSNTDTLRSIKSETNASFLRAARAGNIDKLLGYINDGTDINASNSNGLNAVHLASKEGHVTVIEELLRRGAAVDAATKKGNTALHIASLAGRLDVVSLLIEKGAKVNVQSQNGFTALYMAAQENHVDVVRYLLLHSANQTLATEDGFTPLAVALQQGHEKVVALLLENDSGGKVHLPALHIAAKKDDVKAATLLLQNAHNMDKSNSKANVCSLANDTTKSGFTPLHIAAHYGNTNVAQLLIQKGADVNFKARNSITPLHVASKWGRTSMATVLLDNGAVIDCQTRDGLTPLHCAARSGHDQVVDLLLEHQAPVMAKTKNGLGPLHMAIQGDHCDCVRLLLLRHAAINDVTVDYLTPLHVAAHCGNVKTAKLLLDRKCEVNARALNGFTPLHIACKKNRIKVVELLLKYGATVEATTESGLTPMHVAAFMGHMNIMLYLIQHGAGIDSTTVRGETALHLAARANQTDVMRILLRNGAQVDARAREQQTPLHIASRLGNVDSVALLLQHGASPDATTSDLYTALHIAAKEGHEDVIVVLLDHGANMTLTTKKGFSPLHIAAKYGHLRAARLLLKRGADPNVEGRNGLTPLHVATHYGHISVALMLMENSANPCCVAKNGYTPLHISAKKNLMDIAPTLLEYGAKPNAESRNGFTPLHLAAQDGHTDMASLLLERGADVNCRAKNGLTPLHLTAQEDRVTVATTLVQFGSQIDPQTKAGYTPLHTACHFGQMNMIRFLLEHKASVNATTKMGYTPLHHAAQQGHVQVVSQLLKSGASPDAVSTAGQTPMSIAERLGYLSVVEILRPVTAVAVPAPSATDDKYRVISPEIMQEAPMSDSEEEGGDDNVEQPDQSFKYLQNESMKYMNDDSVISSKDNRDLFSFEHRGRKHSGSSSVGPGTIREELKYMRDEEDGMKEGMLTCESVTHQYSSYTPSPSPYIYDSVDHSYVPPRPKPSKLRWKSFLVSFLVDARGGALRGCRHGGVRVLVPPGQATMPTRVTCKLIRKERLMHPPPLMEGEALASRVLEMGPVGTQLLGSIVIEVPHFASLRGDEREIAVLRSDDGQKWYEHTQSTPQDSVHELLEGHFEDYQEDFASQGALARIVTKDFPMYFAIVTRVRLETTVVGADGGVLSSKVIPQVQAVFPQSALSRPTKVALQVVPVAPELVSRLVGSNRVAVSPVVTLAPRRRKFHQPVILTVPLPRAVQRGMINQYGSSGTDPNLRLLCSVTGTDTFAYLVGDSSSVDQSPNKPRGPSPAHWEDITGSTPLTLVNDCVSFTTLISARFWLVDIQNVHDAVKMATDLYCDLVSVPFMSKFVVFTRRDEPSDAKLRLFCMTDDKMDKTLEGQEHFAEISRSRDIEVLEGRPQYVEIVGNLAAVTKSGEQPSIVFHSFHENRLALTVRVRDPNQEALGRVAFFCEPRNTRVDAPLTPTCSLNIRLPAIDDSTAGTVVETEGSEKTEDVHEEQVSKQTITKNETNFKEIEEKFAVSSDPSYIDSSYDPLKDEIGSSRELGSSRESSIQRGASLDVSYDDRDLFKLVTIRASEVLFKSSEIPVEEFEEPILQETQEAVRVEIQQEMPKEVQEEMHEAVHREVQKEFQWEVHQEPPEEVHEEVQAVYREATHREIPKEVRERVFEVISDEMQDEVMLLESHEEAQENVLEEVDEEQAQEEVQEDVSEEVQEEEVHQEIHEQVHRTIREEVFQVRQEFHEETIEKFHQEEVEENFEQRVEEVEEVTHGSGHDEEIEEDVREEDVHDEEVVENVRTEDVHEEEVMENAQEEDVSEEIMEDVHEEVYSVHREVEEKVPQDIYTKLEASREELQQETDEDNVEVTEDLQEDVAEKYDEQQIQDLHEEVESESQESQWEVLREDVSHVRHETVTHEETHEDSYTVYHTIQQHEVTFEGETVDGMVLAEHQDVSETATVEDLVQVQHLSESEESQPGQQLSPSPAEKAPEIPPTNLTATEVDEGATPSEQSPVIADRARSDPLVDSPEKDSDAAADRAEKADDTGEDITDHSEVEECDEWEVVETVSNSVVMQTENISKQRYSSGEESSAPQNLPDPEHSESETKKFEHGKLDLDRPVVPEETAVVENPPPSPSSLLQRVAIEESEEMRDDGFRIIKRTTTMQHFRAENGADLSIHSGHAGKVLLGLEIEEEITELAPGVPMPYPDEAEVETMWDESEEDLPDGVWMRRKTTHMIVTMPEVQLQQTNVESETVAKETVVGEMSPVLTHVGETIMQESSEFGLTDSGYRDGTAREFTEDESNPEPAVESEEVWGLSPVEMYAESQKEMHGVAAETSDGFSVGISHHFPAVGNLEPSLLAPELLDELHELQEATATVIFTYKSGEPDGTLSSNKPDNGFEHDQGAKSFGFGLGPPQIALQAASPLVQSPDDDIDAAFAIAGVPAEVQQQPEKQDSEKEEADDGREEDMVAEAAESGIDNGDELDQEEQELDEEEDDKTAELIHIGTGDYPEIEQKEQDEDEFGEDEEGLHPKGEEETESFHAGSQPQEREQEEEAPMEGRISADTSEQIFISQMIEKESAAKVQTDRKASAETGPVGSSSLEGIALGFDDDDTKGVHSGVLGCRIGGLDPRSPGADGVARSSPPTFDVDQLQSSLESDLAEDVLRTHRLSDKDKLRMTSPFCLSESPPEKLSPTHELALKDDLSPVTDHPPSKRKIAINIGSSPSGFILEEDEEEEELGQVEARVFRPIVETQSSSEQPPEQDEDEDDEDEDGTKMAEMEPEADDNMLEERNTPECQSLDAESETFEKMDATEIEEFEAHVESTAVEDDGEESSELFHSEDVALNISNNDEAVLGDGSTDADTVLFQNFEDGTALAQHSEVDLSHAANLDVHDFGDSGLENFEDSAPQHLIDFSEQPEPSGVDGPVECDGPVEDIAESVSDDPSSPFDIVTSEDLIGFNGYDVSASDHNGACAAAMDQSSTMASELDVEQDQFARTGSPSAADDHVPDLAEAEQHQQQENVDEDGTQTPLLQTADSHEMEPPTYDDSDDE